MDARLNLFGNPDRRQDAGVHHLGGQGDLDGRDAAGCDAAAGGAPRQSDQWLWFLHRHAHQGRRARRGDLDGASTRSRPGGRPRRSPMPSALPWSWRSRAPASPTVAVGVMDEAWANAAKHYDEDQLAALGVPHRLHEHRQPRERHCPAARRRLPARPVRITAKTCPRRNSPRQYVSVQKSSHSVSPASTISRSALPLIRPISHPKRAGGGKALASTHATSCEVMSRRMAPASWALVTRPFICSLMDSTADWRSSTSWPWTASFTPQLTLPSRTTLPRTKQTRATGPHWPGPPGRRPGGPGRAGR